MKLRRALLASLLTLATTPAGAWRLEDSLRGSTRGNQVGGTISAEGWRTTDRTDRVWYALPRLVSGSIEFTVTGLTMDRLGGPVDNEIFAMYEAGYGIREPISYGDFRENHYKCMLRIYGNGEAGREGQQKLMWGMCPGGAPGFGACACASFFEEPFGGNGTWDGSPQRIRVEWGGGVTRLLRNGARVVSIDWSRSGLAFGPESLHFSLGTSRPSAVGGAQIPVGITFSDLVIDGTEGPLAVCPGTVVDAGAPRDVPPADATVSPSGVIDLPAVEDVTVEPGNPTRVYPDVNDLAVGAADSEFYLKFRVPSFSGRVVRAQLLLRAGNYPSAEGTGASVFAAGRDDWSEATLTYSARPGSRGARLARVNGVSPDTLYTVELPAGAVTGAGTWAFAVLPEAGDANSAHFDARERGGGRGPILRLTIDPSAPLDAGTPPFDAGVPPVDAPLALDVPAPRDVPIPSADLPGAVDVVNDRLAPQDDGPLAIDAGTSDAAGTVVDAPVTGSCGCRAGSHGRGGPLALLGVLALLRRRRRVIEPRA